MKKENIEIVEKPYLRGSYSGKDARKLILKKMLGMVGIVFLFFLGGSMLGLGGFFGSIIPMVLLVVIVAVYQYNKGQEHGASDVAFGEIIYGQKEQGRPVNPEDQERCYHPAKGFFVALMAALPFVLIALVYAVIAKRTFYTLTVLPSWVDNLMVQEEFAASLGYYNEKMPLTAYDILRTVVRSMCMPLMVFARSFGDGAVLVAERFSPLFLLIPPLSYGLGYLCGPSIRTRINTGIQIGVKKKLKKQRRERRKRRASNTPERLI